MVIFANLEDKNKVFGNGPYFFKNVGLFMKFGKERYNLETEKKSW